jgi:uncharacterized membrane protein (UPF0136 family)
MPPRKPMDASAALLVLAMVLWMLGFAASMILCVEAQRIAVVLSAAAAVAALLAALKARKSATRRVIGLGVFVLGCVTTYYLVR